MSRHRIYHNYDYENDLEEFDGGLAGVEEEPVSAEDQALMKEGTAAVQEALGSEVDKVSVAQIQEALWHYFYDIDKSVVYLLNKFIAPPVSKPAKSKAKPEQDGEYFSSALFQFSHECAALADPKRVLTADDVSGLVSRKFAHRFSRNGQGATLRHSRATGPPVSCASFFLDMPWLCVPRDRQAVFIEPQLPKGGLLGGSGAPPKMSKLQALAAARKKKSGDRKSEDKLQEAEQSLKKLAIREGESQPVDVKRHPHPEMPAKRRKLAQGSGTISASASEADQQISDVAPSPGDPLDLGDGDDVEMKVKFSEAPTAPPSIFAQTLFGSSQDQPTLAGIQHFALPYVAFVQDAFSGPSPDDVVLAAQAKGSLSGKGAKK